MAILPEEPPQPSRKKAEEKIKKPDLSVKIKYYANRLNKLLELPKEFLGLTRNKLAKPQTGMEKAKVFLLGTALPHLAIIFLSLIVIASNWRDKATALALYSDLVYVDPASEYAILQQVDGFTPNISSDAEMLHKVTSNTSSADGFVSNVASVETQITSREEPLPDNSSNTVYYAVRNGDTLTGIGWKFGIKLATLKYVNDLNNDTIRPGAELKIPPRGYEVSAAAIAKKKSEKQAKLAMTKRSTLTRSASTARAADNYQARDDGVNLAVPLSYSYISRGAGGGHSGIDYVAGNGTPVYAAESGVVIQVSTGWSGGYGNQIVISHGSGIATRYAHLSKISVSAGTRVSKGQLIGNVGNSGRAYGASGGYHLHFEELVNGRWVKPQF